MPSAETFVVDDTHNLIPGRLATFKEWPFTSSSDKCVPRALAEAGFIHRPDVSPDSVQCFVCQKVLGGWEANEDPMEEHRSHCPNCAFVQLMSTTEAGGYEKLPRKAIIETECARFRGLFTEVFLERLKSHRNSLDSDLERVKAAAAEHLLSEEATVNPSEQCPTDKKKSSRKRSAR